MTRLTATPATPRPLLDALIAAAKAYGTASPAEIQQQRISFVYGNMPKGSTLLRSDVENAIYARHGNLTELDETIKRLTQALGEACEAIQGLLPWLNRLQHRCPTTAPAARGRAAMRTACRPTMTAGHC